MKLTPAQEKVLTQAKSDIDLARILEYPEWMRETCKNFRPEVVEEDIAENRMKNYWEEHRNAIVLAHCNSKTLEKLEKLGLIEIIYDSKNEKGYGIDHIRILNY